MRGEVSPNPERWVQVRDRWALWGTTWDDGNYGEYVQVSNHPEDGWARFKGNRVSTEVKLVTGNEHDFNDWKGVNDVTATGSFTISLNGYQCWRGRLTKDISSALALIATLIPQLEHHEAIRWDHPISPAEQLQGRRVYLGQTPCVVKHVWLGDGDVYLEPVGSLRFPPSAYSIDQEGAETGEYDWDEEFSQGSRYSILDKGIRWDRERCFEDEEPLPKVMNLTEDEKETMLVLVKDGMELSTAYHSARALEAGE